MKLSQKEVAKIVKSKKGTLLSAYVNTSTAFKVRCKKGHISHLRLYSIQNNNSWCKACVIEEKKTKLQQKAKKLNLIITSTLKDVGGTALISLKCKKCGTTWTTEIRRVNQETTSCKKCGIEKRNAEYAKSMIGKKFGKLTIIKKLDRSYGRHFIWKCKCTCGRFAELPTDTVKKRKCCSFHVPEHKYERRTFPHTKKKD